MHASYGSLCTEDCRHVCPSCERGESCEDLFMEPVAGLVACETD